MEISTQIISIGIVLGSAGAGVVVGVLRWSIIRNINALDLKMEEVKDSVVDLSRAVVELRSNTISCAECANYRRDCSERHVLYQQDILGWMRRQEDKTDRLLMIMANINNGLGGVKNGLKSEL